MSSSKRISKEWIRYVGEFPWSHMLTLTFGSEDHLGKPLSAYPLSGRHLYMMQRTKIFVRHLSCRIYKNSGRPIFHFGVAETQTKNGNPTHFHIHMLLSVEDAKIMDFLRNAQLEWEKLNQFNNIGYCCNPVFNRKGAARYVTKKIDSDLDFITCLPMAKVLV